MSRRTLGPQMSEEYFRGPAAASEAPETHYRARCAGCGKWYREEIGAYRLKRGHCDTCAAGGPF